MPDPSSDSQHFARTTKHHRPDYQRSNYGAAPDYIRTGETGNVCAMGFRAVLCGTQVPGDDEETRTDGEAIDKRREGEATLEEEKELDSLLWTGNSPNNPCVTGVKSHRSSYGTQMYDTCTSLIPSYASSNTMYATYYNVSASPCWRHVELVS